MGNTQRLKADGKKTQFESVWRQLYGLKNCQKDEDESCAEVARLPVTAYQNTIGQTVSFVSTAAYGDKSYNRIEYNVVMGDTPDLSQDQTVLQPQLIEFSHQLNHMNQAALDQFLNQIKDSFVLMHLLNEPLLNEMVKKAIRFRLAALKQQRRLPVQNKNQQQDSNPQNPDKQKSAIVEEPHHSDPAVVTTLPGVEKSSDSQPK